MTHRSVYPEAEREGFEPSRELAPPTRLAGECLQPLGHLSGVWATILVPPSASSPAGTRYARAAVSATGTSPPIAAPTADREALHARYEAIFDSITAPFAFVDLDALRANARFMLAQAAGKPIRIASKSVRSVAVLRRILELDPGFEGILAFTLPEALFLARQGFEDIVVAYPTADREALAELVELAAAEPGERAGADGRQPASPRPDRVGDRGRPGRGPRLPRPRRRLVAAGREAGADRPQALAGADPGAGPPDGGRDRGAARARAWPA